MDVDEPSNAIRFAERVLELLEDGRYTATYKYAVLLGLMDLCLEQTQATGAPPTMVTTPQMAAKVVELYWPHTRPYLLMGVPRQITGTKSALLHDIHVFREAHAPEPSTPRWEAIRAAPLEYAGLLRQIEATLIRQPLPRLQSSDGSRALLYNISWDTTISPSLIKRYQRGDSLCFDNRLLLQPSVGDHLLSLNGLLRPLIQRRWAMMVARLNSLEESQLESYLFGSNRIATQRVRAGLWEMQDRRCFYCDRRVPDPGRGHVDHFIPWARHPDDSLDNFVFADERCNAEKSASLAADIHLARWSRRLRAGAPEFSAMHDLASLIRWERNAERSRNVARGIYLRLPDDARLWLRAREYTNPAWPVINRALLPPPEPSGAEPPEV